MEERPRVGIDGYNLALPNGTGIATYARTLAATLRLGGHRVEGVFGIDVGHDPELAETLFFERLARPGRLPFSARYWPLPPTRAHEVALGKVDRGAFAERLPQFDRVVSAPHLFPRAVRYFRRFGRFVRLRVPDPPAIMHWTYPVPIVLEGARNVYTLHDLVPLKLPHTTLDAKRHFNALARACMRHGAICTVSEASKADIVAMLGIDPAEVHNCYQAALLPPDLLARPRAEDEAAVRNVLGLEPQGYFLYLGAIEPKKNVGRLIEAHLSTGSATPLVLAGGRAWASDGELALLPEGAEAETPHGRSVAERVIRLDHLPRPLLLQLIRAARAVVFPSIYEGFGLPVLEAMRLGVPVLTSTAGSLPEVAGDAALLVDPYDVRAIAAGLRTLDGEAEVRARLAVAGPVQAERFSQARFLDRLEVMYARLATPPVSR